MTWRKIVYPSLIFAVIFLNFAPLSVLDTVSNICGNEISASDYNYIVKYKYALKNELPDDLQPNGRYQNCVWTLWLQGEKNAPQIIKNCIESMKIYLKHHRLIVLDENSIHKYINLPKYIIDKYKSGKISKTYFSDIIRYCLLYKYGGLWLDSTLLLTGEFPGKILAQDFFMFSVRNTFSRRLYEHITASWLIHSNKPGNIICKNLTKLNFEYWKCENNLIFYWMIYLLFKFVVENDAASRTVFERMPRIYEQWHFFMYYQQLYSDGLLSDLIKYSYFPIHKLTYRNHNTYKYVINQAVSQFLYEHCLINFFNRKDALEELQKRGLAKIYE